MFKPAMTHFFNPRLFLCLVTLAFLPVQSRPASVDDLLLKKEMLAQAIDTMDVELETIIESPEGVTSSTKMRMCVDKGRGMMRLHQYDSKGRVAVDMIVDGGEVHYKSAAGRWIKLNIDPQSLESLKALGVDPEAMKQEKMKGLAKGKAEAKGPSAAMNRVSKMRERFEFKRDSAKDRQGKGQRALLRRIKGNEKVRPFEEELLMIDEASGMVMEQCKFARPRAVGKKLPTWAARKQSEAGEELVEFTRTMVKKRGKRRGLDVVEESETWNATGLGTVKTRSKWNYRSVNQSLPAGMFEKD